MAVELTDSRQVNRYGRGLAEIAVASVLWGTTGTAASLLPDDVSPLAIGASTMAVGGALLFLVFVRPASAALRDPRSRRWLALGAVGVVAYALAFYTAMHLAGVAVGNVVALGSGPVFAAVLEAAFEGHRPSRRWMVATGLAVVGVVLLAIGDVDAGPAVPLGVGLGLLAGLSYALYTYASSRAIRLGVPSGGAMGGMFGLAVPPLALVLLLWGAPLLGSPGFVAVVGYLALGPMLLAYVLFGAGLRTVRSSYATTISLIEPVVATVLAVLVVGERPGVIGWIGLVVVLFAVTVLVSARPPAVREESP